MDKEPFKWTWKHTVYAAIAVMALIFFSPIIMLLHILLGFVFGSLVLVSTVGLCAGIIYWIERRNIAEKKKYEFKWWHAVVGCVTFLIITPVLSIGTLIIQAGGPPGSKAWHDFAQRLGDEGKRMQDTAYDYGIGIDSGSKDESGKQAESEPESP